MSHTIVYDTTKRSAKERAFHALTFEVIAILLITPTASWVMGHSIAEMGALTIMFAVIAMLCNVIFNFLFDLAQRRMKFKRTTKVRIIHTVLFEGFFIMISLPLACWWLSISLFEAFMLDLSLTLFFLIYTFVFNYLYDYVRESLFIRRMSKRGLSVKVLY